MLLKRIFSHPTHLVIFAHPTHTPVSHVFSHPTHLWSTLYILTPYTPIILCLYSHTLGSVLAEFLPSFPSQICVSDVTLTSHLTYIRIYIKITQIFSEWRHILAPPVQNFFEREEMWRFGWDWNMFLPSRLRFVTYLGSVKREGHLGQDRPLHTYEALYLFSHPTQLWSTIYIPTPYTPVKRFPGSTTSTLATRSLAYTYMLVERIAHCSWNM